MVQLGNILDIDLEYEDTESYNFSTTLGLVDDDGLWQIGSSPRLYIAFSSVSDELYAWIGAKGLDLDIEFNEIQRDSIISELFSSKGFNVKQVFDLLNGDEAGSARKHLLYSILKYLFPEKELTLIISRTEHGKFVKFEINLEKYLLDIKKIFTLIGRHKWNNLVKEVNKEDE